jgi:hypothetical protein
LKRRRVRQRRRRRKRQKSHFYRCPANLRRPRNCALVNTKTAARRLSSDTRPLALYCSSFLTPPGVVPAPSLTCRLVPAHTTSNIHVVPSAAVLVHLDVPPPLVCRRLQILHPWLNRRLDFRESPQLPAQRVTNVVVSVRHPLPSAPAVQAVQRLLGECPCREIGPVGLSDYFHELAVTWPRARGPA